MEADWSVELAADDPVIVAPWEAGGGCRFIDLRRNRAAIDEIEEARREPALRSALVALNGPGSRLWTAKCGLWRGEPEAGHLLEDPREMEAQGDEARFLAGSYIDLLRDGADRNRAFEQHEGWMRELTGALRSERLSCARTDFVIRRADLWDVPGFGVTWYVEGCGATQETAGRRWAEALTHILAAVRETAPLAWDATMAKARASSSIG
jgi:hypothetical protein